MKIYEVGGAVRDRLLGRPVQDRDWVVVGGDAETMKARGFRPVGKDFPVFLHPETHEEHALARTERKTGHGYGGFSFDTSTSVSLEEDLGRRDLTINAMAIGEDGVLVDPFDGRADLDRGILRHVGPAFVEDPLRVLRVARFAARLGFTVAPETLALMRELAESGELSFLAPERVWRELQRALDDPYPDLFIRVLRECGALARLFPEIDALFGVPQPARYHPEIDTGDHICLALRQAAVRRADNCVRFAVLVHDLGKALTPEAYLPGHPGHDESGVALIDAFSDRWRVPSSHRALAILVARFHIRIHRCMELRPEKLFRMLESLDAFRRPERLEQVVEACVIDIKGRAGREDAEYPQGHYLLRAADAARSVDVAALRADGLDGAELGEAIGARRIDALARLRQENRPN